MGPSEPPLQPIALSAGRIDEALTLSCEAGWNQVADDWRMMLAAGRGFGYEAPDGRLVATAVMLPFGRRFGWISMVIVAHDWRRRGLARRLLRTSVEGLERQGLAPVLDATPEGEVIYSGMGFATMFPITRWEKAGDGSLPGIDHATSGQGELPPLVEALDRMAFGGERPDILRGLWQRSGGFARAVEGRGFMLARVGRRAVQLGPLCSNDGTWAADTLEQALDALPGAVFVDVPDRQEGIRDILVRRGFRVQRPFLRMAKGDMNGASDPASIFAIAGPELG